MGLNGYILKKKTKETKLRMQNITAKLALKCGHEHWALKERDAKRLQANF